MFCPNCGNETKEVSQFCPVCQYDLAHILGLMEEPEDDDEDWEDVPRTAKEIARGALVLSAVIACAYGASKEETIKWLQREGLWAGVSPLEMEFLSNDVSEKERANLTWKVEALVPLLWTINKIGSMPALTQQCNTGPLKSAVIWPPAETREYIESSVLRSEDELEGEYEKVYQAHWKVRDARINGRPISDGYDPEVIYERHYGFNWIIGYMGQSWDDVSTDT